ncbi:hypothetical protein M3Y95_00340100 [Aphelenchoides besseyi]|nr:hypothetical protein M3Y95_00340100 [Aphelenchoides besseyi]
MVFNLGDFSNARCQQHFQALIRKVKLSLVNQVDEFGFYNVVLPKNFTKFRLQYFPSQNRFLVVSKFRLIFEDAKIFDRFSSTFIQNFPNSKNKWIRKIINGTREPEMVVYRDEDFVLVDNKRKRKKVSGLCYMALVTRCDLRCLRDLTADHIPLLENILFKGSKFLCDRHKIPRSRLLVYFHYPATYTHLHVHFRELCDFHSFQIHPLTSPLASHQFPAGSRCVFLEEVIANLRLMSDFYQHSTLPLFLTTQFEWLKVFNKL